MFEKLNWLLMVLPFALWGTAMAAMAPLVDSGGPELVATLRLLPAGIVILFAVPFLGRRWTIAQSDLSWFLKIANHINKLNMYKFPEKKELGKLGIKTIFLGN